MIQKACKRCGKFSELVALGEDCPWCSRTAPIKSNRHWFWVYFPPIAMGLFLIVAIIQLANAFLF
jgi:hypothetical protein